MERAAGADIAPPAGSKPDPPPADGESPDTYPCPIFNGSRSQLLDNGDTTLWPCGCAVHITCEAALAKTLVYHIALVNDTGDHPPAAVHCPVLRHDDEVDLGQLHPALFNGVGDGFTPSHPRARVNPVRSRHPIRFPTDLHVAAAARRHIQTSCGCDPTLQHAVRVVVRYASYTFPSSLPFPHPPRVQTGGLESRDFLRRKHLVARP